LCIKERRKKTNLEKYGVDNPLKNEKIKEKVRNTMKKKYNEEYPILVKEFKDKMKKTIMEKYGVNHPLKSDEIKLKVKNKWKNKTKNEKIILKNKKIKSWSNLSDKKKKEIDDKRKKTNLEKYGNEYVIQNKEIKNKIKNILKNKYNVENTPFENIDIRKKSSDTYKRNKINLLKNKLITKNCSYVTHSCINNNIEYLLKCNKTNKIFKISYTNLRLRLLSELEISPYVYKKGGESKMEKDIRSFIHSKIDIELKFNIKNIILSYELDIYIPDLKLAFEFNGLYWHNELYKDKNYHLNKTELCEKNGIQLIHIYEDEWIYKQDIVKSMILNKLGKTPTKIYARKCEVREITDNKLVREFLDENHIRGYIISSIKIGLFYENELVSLMIFIKRKNNYELLRFCNKLNTNVVGGGNKLFKHFVKNYDPKMITTYTDRSWSNGNLYNQLGFKYEGKTDPNYYYIIDGIRHHRFNFRKDKLVKEGYDPSLTEHQIMINRKIYRIFDSGNLKFNF
jgi:very-short-patch-repair endonuclease